MSRIQHFIAFITLITASGFTTASAKDSNAPYIDPSPGRIAIMANSLCSYSKTHRADHADFKRLAEAGFTIGTESYGASDVVARTLKNAHGTNVKFAVASAGLYYNDSTCRTIVNRFKDSPELAMWIIRDEPHYDQLPHLAEITRTIREIDPDHMVYMNLIGSPSEPDREFAKKYPEFCWEGDYTKYLDMIDRMFCPSVWVYDLYPLSINRNTGKSVLNRKFYQYLEFFSDMAKKTGRPFWTHCLGVQFNAYKTKDGKRERISHISATPTLSTLSFEIFSSLAYGAQGIVYWTYGQREDKLSIQFSNASLDIDNMPTKTWEYARDVNLAVERFNDVFYGSRLMGARHTGSYIPEGTTPLTGKFGPVERVSASGDGVMLTHLNTNGKDYLIVVNHDPYRSQSLEITFGAGFTVRDITNPRERRAGRRQTLEAGGFRIYEWSK